MKGGGHEAGDQEKKGGSCTEGRKRVGGKRYFQGGGKREK